MGGSSIEDVQPMGVITQVHLIIITTPSLTSSVYPFITSCLLQLYILYTSVYVIDEILSVLLYHHHPSLITIQFSSGYRGNGLGYKLQDVGPGPNAVAKQVTMTPLMPLDALSIVHHPIYGFLMNTR